MPVKGLSHQLHAARDAFHKVVAKKYADTMVRWPRKIGQVFTVYSPD